MKYLFQFFFITAFIRFQNINFVGNDHYKSLQFAQVDDCEAECEYDERCHGYLYNQATRVCWLKSNANQFQIFEVNEHRTFGGIKVRPVID